MPGEGTLPAERGVEQGDHRVDVLRRADRGAEVLLRPREAGVDGVQVQFQPVLDLGGDGAAGEPVHVVEAIGKSYRSSRWVPR